jgi:hypothetical protein
MLDNRTYIAYTGAFESIPNGERAMATRSQIAANRRNGARSKGPRTEEGQAVASRNSLKHGLTAEHVVLLFGEAEDDFTRLHDEMRASFAPMDAVEEQLVEHAVLCAWRLRRAYRAEAESMNSKLTEIYEYRKERGTHKKWVPCPPIAFDGTTWDLERISRYEVTNERALHRALMMLERRQARRRNEPVPAPIAIRVESLDGAETPIAMIDSIPSAPERET